MTPEEVNKAFKEAEEGKLNGILSTTDDPLVSSDFIAVKSSSIIDLSLTQVVGGNLVKVIAWYDNEWGYSERLVDIVELVSKK